MTTAKMLLALLGAIIGISSAQTLHLWNITEGIDGLSSSCIETLNQAIACDPVLLEIRNADFNTDEVLDTVCTSACSTGFSTYVRRVDRACGTSRYDGGDGWLYLPLASVEPVYEKLETICLKDA